MPGRVLEFHLIKAAWDAGVTVPEPLWDGDDRFGVKFFVMRRLAGETLGARMIRGEQYAPARASMPGQLAQSLARIHRVRKESHAELATLPGPLPGASVAQAELDNYEAAYRQATPNPHPVFELALAVMIPARSERLRHLRKYAEGNLGPQSFFFRGPGAKMNLRAQNLTAFCELAAGVDDDTWLFHLRRGDDSAWMRGVIKDDDLAREVVAVEDASHLEATESRPGMVRDAINRRYMLPA